MAEIGYTWTFYKERNILYHKGINYSGISTCQNYTGIRRHFLSYDIKSISQKKKGQTELHKNLTLSYFNKHHQVNTTHNIEENNYKSYIR